MSNAPVARRIRDAIEPFVGSVYFAPDCHERYVALGFAPSPADADGVALPDGPAYFTSRGSLMGQVTGHVVAAAFAVFNPAAVIPAVARGWELTDAKTIRQARQEGAVSQLRRILGEAPQGVEGVADLFERAVASLGPAGRPLFAGVISEPAPAAPLDRAWFFGDALREFRGDSHNAAWLCAGLDAIEIGLMTELFWGLPLHSYVRTRAWSDDEVDGALERLVARGWVADRTFTDAGKAARESIEAVTDAQMEPAIKVFGDAAEDIVTRVGTWSSQVRAGKGYLTGADALSRRSAGS